MDLTPQAFHKKYQDRGLVGHLLGATDYAKQELSHVSFLDVVRKGNTGDIVTRMDRTVHDSVIRYFQENGISAVVLGEEGSYSSDQPQLAILIDEIEGTQNAVNGLDYGINIAVAKYKPQLKVKDLEAAVVVNLRIDKTFVGEKGRVYVIDNGVERDLAAKETDIYETPSAEAYTVTENQRARQKALIEIFVKKLGNQPRSIDATGTRLVEVADGNIGAYGDWRHATKSWDVLPSALILTEAGFKVTDVYGFEFDEAILYDESNGLNKRIGENVIAASPEEHELLVFGDSKPLMSSFLQYSFIRPSCLWDFSVRGLESELPIRVGKFHDKTGLELTVGEVNELRKSFGTRIATNLVGIVKDRLEAYGDLNPANIERITDFYRDRYLVRLMNDFRLTEDLPPVHIGSFDQVVAN
jgi:fructose-1,6-bisphosphatase/inositol monophosphatase family enzyme